MSFSSGLPVDLPQDELEVLRADLVQVRGHAVAERGHEVRELLDPLRVGLLVDAVEGGHVGLGEPRRHRLVGGEHELLDDAHAVEPLAGHDAGHLRRPASSTSFGSGRSKSSEPRS